MMCGQEEEFLSAKPDRYTQQLLGFEWTRSPLSVRKLS
jgi:hypothetical protein